MWLTHFSRKDRPLIRKISIFSTCKLFSTNTFCHRASVLTIKCPQYNGKGPPGNVGCACSLGDIPVSPGCSQVQMHFWPQHWSHSCSSKALWGEQPNPCSENSASQSLLPFSKSQCHSEKLWGATLHLVLVFDVAEWCKIMIYGW